MCTGIEQASGSFDDLIGWIAKRSGVELEATTDGRTRRKLIESIREERARWDQLKFQHTRAAREMSDDRNKIAGNIHNLRRRLNEMLTRLEAA